MTLHKKIKLDLISALKGGDKDVVSTLRLLQAAIKNREIDLKKREVGLSDDEVIDAVTKEIKKRKDAIDAYNQGGRNDLAEKESKELEILQQYLPKQLTEEEIKGEVENAIKETGAQSVKDFGKVMGVVMQRVKGRAEGGRVSEMVKKMLS